MNFVEDLMERGFVFLQIWHRCPIVIFFLLLCFLGPLRSYAEIRSMEIRSDATPIITFDSFGFSGEGRLELDVTNLAVNPPSADLTWTGFFLCSLDSCLRLPKCPLDSHSVVTITHLPSGVTAFHVSFDVKASGYFTLGFANCLAPLLAVTMNVSSAMFNLDGHDPSLPAYLSAGSSCLPQIYFYFFLAHSFLAGIWVVILYRKGIPASAIQHLMLGLLILNALHLLFESKHAASLNHTGRVQDSWDVLAFVCNFLKSIGNFTLFILVGSGWVFFKPHLVHKEKMVLMFVISLQCFANFTQIAMDKKVQFARNQTLWNRIFLLVDALCSAVAMLPAFWSLRRFRVAIQVCAGNAQKRSMYVQYHMVVFEFLVAILLYIIFTRVVVYAMLCELSFQYAWAGIATAELATLMLYVFIGYRFWPKVHKLFLASDDEEGGEDVADEALTQSKGRTLSNFVFIRS